MSEKNNIDFLVKSVLGDAREKAPERIWEGVSAGLDRAARRRAAVLWLGRGVAGAAAAAAIVCGVFFWGGPEGDGAPAVAEVVRDSVEVVAPGEGAMESVEVVAPEWSAMNSVEVVVPGEGAVDGAIAEAMGKVAEGAMAEGVLAEAPVKKAMGDGLLQDTVLTEGPAVEEALLAENKTADKGIAEESEGKGNQGESIAEEFVPAGSGDMIAVVKPEKTDERYAEAKEIPAETTEYFPEDWGEEDVKKKKNISLLLSGIAGANADVSQKRIGPMRSPGSSAQAETGIQETSVKSSFGVPLSVGAGVKIELTPHWALSVGANYTFLSRQFFGTYTEVNEAGVIEVSKQSTIRNHQHYVGIPVNAYYNIINSNIVYFYAYAGGAVERNICDLYTLMGSDINYKKPAKGVQLSANLGVGVEFMLGKHLGLYLDPSLRYYFNNRQPRSIRTVQPLMFGMEMGLRVKL